MKSGTGGIIHRLCCVSTLLTDYPNSPLTLCFPLLISLSFPQLYSPLCPLHFTHSFLHFIIFSLVSAYFCLHTLLTWTHPHLSALFSTRRVAVVLSGNDLWAQSCILQYYTLSWAGETTLPMFLCKYLCIYTCTHAAVWDPGTLECSEHICCFNLPLPSNQGCAY